MHTYESIARFKTSFFPVHKLAKKPVVKKIEEKVDYNEDFLF